MELHAAGRAVHVPAITILLLLLAACGNDRPGADDAPAWASIAAEPAPPVPEADARSVTRTATQLLTALTVGETDEIWAMLLPEGRERWPDEAALREFLGRKFGSHGLTYELGEPHFLGAGDTIAVQVTLQLEDVPGRYTGPPLVLVRRDGDWGIVDAGPLGPRGPVIGTPSPLWPELDVPILIYHHVSPDRPVDPKQWANTVAPMAFADQLSWLGAEGYQTITVAELFNAFYYGLRLPPRPVMLVFDDSYGDVYQHAFPLLRERGFGATVAAITGFMEQPGYLTWRQATEMSAAGVEFVSHTVTHADLAAKSRAEMWTELAQSRLTLEERLGRPAQFFVYPYGEPFVKGSAEARELVQTLLRETGYAGALTTSSGSPYVSIQRADAPYQLRRIPVSGGESVERFAASIRAAP
ncbi:MAG TPA: polysaccharide deacetylase family protein [Dehalococcoidia bacterium]|jgi:peptidoglycan/xylan/chitin deacetylase (PgdA/CDA1 family)|nr:polysaccharide deacetylase family protein [Dehalococcoidia bacterium]